MQDALTALSRFWADEGCITVQPMNTEVGAGTMNPATVLRVLGPEPWKVAYVEPSVRPDDARYGENPNRIQNHTQFQVIIKPEPGDAQDRYLRSLETLGIDVAAHDVRFVEDNWASPALGAWGLGWEVWLDGLEITQFTYFQQSGGLALDPPSVEITYGMERILMALQGVRHFKDIEYAPGLTYGELFGQTEYEMSRYYLDEADASANRTLLNTYAFEAQRMIDAKLPVPAHTFVLKMSHVFNVLDARGVVSTADRAAEFARMRQLANEVAKLWLATREAAGFPLGRVPAPESEAPVAVGTAPTNAATLVFEIGTEEMPPNEARAARAAVKTALTERLAAGRLQHGAVQVTATPRRIVATVPDVAPYESDHTHTVRGPRTSAAFDAEGAPTRAATGFARSQGVAVESLDRIVLGDAEYLAVQQHMAGRPAAEALAPVLSEVVTGLRSAKNMRWRDPALSFTRPIRWILALLGGQVVPVQASVLAAGWTTRLDRRLDKSLLEVPHAEAYADLLTEAGIILDETARGDVISTAATALAAEVGGQVDLTAEALLLQQINFLVEQPSPLRGSFETQYLELPESVLTTVMRKHQRYLPIRNAKGQLMAHFVTVANGTIDVAEVRRGNEEVLRARFEDASFFYRADLRTPLAQMRSDLVKLTFTDKLGSMADRAHRIGALAGTLAESVTLTGRDQDTLHRAAELVKFDLASQMVVELTSLAGTMAREYSLAAGESPAVAQALLDTELPRTAGGDLPVTLPGALLALADRLDALVGLAATVGLPTGSSDPFAVRRAALGALAILRGTPALGDLELDTGLRCAAAGQPVLVEPETLGMIGQFLTRRLEQQLIDEGQPVDWIRAVLVHATRPRLADQLLRQLADLVNRSDFVDLAAALQRARRIVPADVPSGYDPNVLVEAAERHLHEAVTAVRHDLAGQVDLLVFTAVANGLAKPISAFFDQVLVMSDDPRLRAARLGLLATIRDLGESQLDWSALSL